MSSTITSANSVFTLAIPDVFPTPQNVQGYAADDAFANEPVDAAEAVMGVDGIMSAGFTPFITKLNITLQADSPSIPIFEGWLQAQEAAREVFFANASIVLPSIGRIFTFTKGAMTRTKQLPDAKKILQPVTYEISWESVSIAELS